MNIIVNIYFVFSLYFEVFKIVGNVVIIFKGNLVVLLCCIEYVLFLLYFIVLKNYNWLVNFYYQCYNILFSVKGEEVFISFFFLSMIEWDRMIFFLFLD